MMYRPIGQNRAKKLENPRGFWNNVCRNTSSLFQDSGAFECAQPRDELHAGSTADISRAQKPRTRAQTRPAPSEWRVPAIPCGTAPSSKKSEVFPTGRVVAWPPNAQRASPTQCIEFKTIRLRVCSKSPMLWSVSVVACTETDPGTSPRSADGASTESC